MIKTSVNLQSKMSKHKLKKPADSIVAPTSLYTFAIPNDDLLLTAYNVYKPSNVLYKLPSEKGRTIIAEAFIESNTLGTLADLCVRKLGQHYGNTDYIPLIHNNPIKRRIYYDSLSVELPLQSCHDIDDQKYWQRVVLAKSNKKLQARDGNWKNYGISLKLVELIEDCPAEYWPEEEMRELCTKVEKYVYEMHIRHLKSVNLHRFDHLCDDEENLSFDEDISNVTSTRSTVASIKTNEADKRKNKKPISVEFRNTLEAEMNFITDLQHKTKLRRIHEQEEELRHLAILEAAKRPSPRVRKRKKKPTFGKKEVEEQLVESVYDLPIPPDSEDDPLIVTDYRKKLHKKMCIFPDEMCTHIDFSFLANLRNITVFTIEFAGPLVKCNYHERHLNFAYSDIQHLATGVAALSQLQTFRLRNSRMDAAKLAAICGALQSLTTLEIVDFGNDHLYDDIGQTLYDLFDNSTSITSLELEGNFLSSETMEYLGAAISQYQGCLDYLGLAHNPLQDAGLCKLVEGIAETEQVKRLSLTGIHISGEEDVITCMANELLRKHSKLQELSLAGVAMSHKALCAIMLALETNLTLLQFDYRCCGFDFYIEADIEVMLRRNRYMTTEQVEKRSNPSKHHLYANAQTKAKKLKDCQPPLAQESLERFYRRSITATRKTIVFLDEGDDELKVTSTEDRRGTIITISSNRLHTGKRFVYHPEEFTEQELMKRALLYKL